MHFSQINKLLDNAAGQSDRERETGDREGVKCMTLGTVAQRVVAAKLTLTN